MSPSASVIRTPAISNLPPDPAALPSPEVAPSMAPDPAAAADAIDRSFHAALARRTGGLSPAAVALAFADWQLHLSGVTGKTSRACRSSAAERVSACRCRGAEASDVPAVVVGQAADERPPLFRHRLGTACLQSSRAGLPADRTMVALHHHGYSRAGAVPTQRSPTSRSASALDTVAPTNFAISNPEVLRKIMETGGGNFVSGLHNWVEDWQALLTGASRERISNSWSARMSLSLLARSCIGTS